MNAISRALSCLFGSVLLCSAVSAQGPLLHVDNSGFTAPFKEIADAVAVAPPGATILVEQGNYAPFSVGQHTLVIAASYGAVVNVDPVFSDDGAIVPPLTVSELPAGQVIVIENIIFRGHQGSTATTPGAEIRDCAGQVWLQGCTVFSGTALANAVPALRVENSENVVLTHSGFGGLSSIATQSQWIRPGLHATGSRVFAFEADFQGGQGAAGVLIDDGFFFAELSIIEGGDGFGIKDEFGNCLVTVNGGPGLQTGLGSPTAIVLDTTIAGGPAFAFSGCNSAGDPSLLPTGTLEQLPGRSVGLAVQSPAHENTTPVLTLNASPGDFGVILMATSLPPVSYFAKYQGSIVTGAPLLFLIGTVPSGGALSIPLHLGDLLPPFTASTMFLQSAVLKAEGGAQLGGAVDLTTYGFN